MIFDVLSRDNLILHKSNIVFRKDEGVDVLDFEFLFDPIPNPSPGGEGSAIAPATRWTRAVGVLHLQGELEGVDVWSLCFALWVLGFGIRRLIS